MSINQVIVSGNLTRDPELRQTNAGTAVLAFPVAVNDRVYDQTSGEWGERTSFVDCTMFGKRAAALAYILCKGMHVTVHGKLRQSSWTDAEGARRSRLGVVADDVELPAKKPAQAKAAAAPDDLDAIYDEDLPF